MQPVVFGTGSLGETILAYLFTILLFGLFAGALIVPIVWIVNTTRERWNDYDKKKRIRVILNFAIAIAIIAIALWRGAMPSNF